MKRIGGDAEPVSLVGQRIAVIQTDYLRAVGG